MLSNQLKVNEIIFFGSSGLLSVIPLKNLLKAGYGVSMVVTDQVSVKQDNFAGYTLINTGLDALRTVAEQYSIACLVLTSDLKKNRRELIKLRPDLIVVSCFSHKLSEDILSIPRLGCINIHPSLLPAYRGPSPLFWQFRAGETCMGVTIHNMTEVLDCGDILLQKPLYLKDGVSLQQATKAIADIASQALLEVLADFENLQSKALPQGQFISAETADGRLAGYQSYPVKQDFYIDTSWKARQIYNFMCAYAKPGIVFTCLLNEEILYVEKALMFDTAVILNVPYFVEDNLITLACSDGIIQCQQASYHL